MANFTGIGNTPNKERIFHRILAENGVQEENGALFLEAPIESLYPAILQFAQAVSKVSNMHLFKREVTGVRSGKFNFRAPAVAKAREASKKISNFPGLTPRLAKKLRNDQESKARGGYC